jgi:hypothetical protein
MKVEEGDIKGRFRFVLPGNSTLYKLNTKSKLTSSSSTSSSSSSSEECHLFSSCLKLREEIRFVQFLEMEEVL